MSIFVDTGSIIDYVRSMLYFAGIINDDCDEESSFPFYAYYSVLHFAKRKRGERPDYEGPEETSSTFMMAMGACRSCDWRELCCCG